MKKITALFVFCTLTIATVFVACQKENTNPVLPQTNTAINNGEVGERAPTIGIGITAKPYRGKRWSAKHNVEPCTQGLGLCDVEVSVDVDLAIISHNGGNSYDIEFMQEVGAVAGAEFYGADEDPLELPFSVASYFGNETMTILPDNYVVQVDNEHPYGVVTVNCVQSPLVSQSIWRPFGPLTFEHMAYIGCVPHFGFCSDPFPWPSDPIANLGPNQVAGDVAIINEHYVVCDLDGSTLSQPFVNEILANPTFDLSNNYTLPQNMVEELAMAAGVPIPPATVFNAGLYPVEVIGSPSPAAKIKIKITYDVETATLTIKITFR